ncbi:hypothetical protein AQS70_20635 [Pseudomonas endophytica]|uniref:Uncharacterized protein n=1 Tax=Pseudomonas endophytica TaxID=1563157 RepID=A0A0Q0T3I7_9PSED|nr:hypothetical protein [Pseudomonas endophytica]KQB54794.1 hypothetical protein AQS70_20635 [Pseudomonas endophytica]
MQKPSRDEAIAKSYEKIYDHGHRVRVKAWSQIQAGNLDEANKLLLIADMCDRTLVKVLARNHSVWKRE